MKEYLLQILRTAPSPVQGRNEVREYLQARILGVLQRAGMMIPLAFHGGTALRFLFNAARYSEDLDFTLEKAVPRYDFRSCLQAIQKAFRNEGYQPDPASLLAGKLPGALLRAQRRSRPPDPG